ncbi:MAG TPA: hypothetical protein VH814_06210 [Steroidobacteraceae bacterium]|jgi:hypothetical protein
MTVTAFVSVPRVLRLIAALACTLAALSPAHAATQAELEAKVAELAQQLQEVQRELATLRSQQQPASAPAAAAVANAVTGRAVPDQNKVNWFGYGELNYSRPTDDSSGTTADVGRFVLGASYRFDDRTRFISELEVEHAVSSADDAGEVEVEQAWIERELSDTIYAKLGLFLIPSGLLNESHEPTRYYGVFRNFVETAIIPTTWRELGVALEGNTEAGLRWDVGLTTGHDLSKWDAASEEGLESPLGAIHQEGALARAGDLSSFGALNYTGIPGLRVGGSVVYGDISQGQPGFDDNKLLLWEGHARWMPGAWDLSALYARGHISDTAAVNLTLVGNPVLIPQSFYGWYAQAAYVVTLPNSWTLAPFARFERVNTGADYAFIGAGLTPAALRAEEITTIGINLNIASGVVFKLDYQTFDLNSEGDRIDLGLGYAF